MFALVALVNKTFQFPSELFNAECAAGRLFPTVGLAAQKLHFMYMKLNSGLQTGLLQTVRQLVYNETHLGDSLDLHPCWEGICEAA